MLVERDIAHGDLIQGLKSFASLKALYRSEFYRRNAERLRALLETVHWYVNRSVHPRVRAFVRAVQWNIEKGKNFEGLVHVLSTHPVLREADLLFLNEVDHGMNRSGNRDVAGELSRRLGLHGVFAPAYVELTKGVGAERELPGENTTALQGNAILSRHPVRAARVLALPQCFEYFEFSEKRFGRRIALMADVELPGGRWLRAVCTHLETRTTPRGRARQMAAILRALASWEGPVLIAGDWNTSTFARGTRWRALCGLMRILLLSPERLQHDVQHPDRRGEPLFELLRKWGYSYREWNDEEPTHILPVEVTEDAHYVPGFSHAWVIRKYQPYGCRIGLRLDWFAARQLRVLAAGEVLDGESGVASVRPQTISGLTYQGRPLSDHAPIVVDVALPSHAGSCYTSRITGG